MYLVDELGLDGYREAVITEFKALGGEAFAHDGAHLVNRAPARHSVSIPRSNRVFNGWG